MIRNAVFLSLILTLSMQQASGQAIGYGPFALAAPENSMNFQWYKDSSALIGATDSIFYAIEKGAYWLTFDTDSTVGDFGAFNIIISHGDSSQLHLDAPIGKSGYQWYRGLVPLTLDTAATYSLPRDTTAVGSYWVECIEGICVSQSKEITVHYLTTDCDGDNIPGHIDLDDDGDGEPDITDPNDCDPAISSQGLALAVKLLLASNYDESTGLMWDSLRTLHLIPEKHPYNEQVYSEFAFNGTESFLENIALNSSGNDAIVDWVMLELRDANDSTSIIASRAALLQRDGDVVHVDGSSMVTFPNVAAGDYFVVARHRNHLGVMTATVQALSATPTTVDFTLMATQVYQRTDAAGQRFARAEMNDGKMALWGGNMYKDNGLQRVIFQGGNADVDAAYFQVLLDSLNTGITPIWVSIGYLRSDGNLDGATIFQGGNADVDVPFFTVLPHPNNSFFSPIFVVFEQLP